MKDRATEEPESVREVIVTRVFDAPPHIVYEAWTKAELFRQWWVPKSLAMTLLSCDMDVRIGGQYRLVFRHPAGLEPMAFHGTYLDVVAPSRLVWTNEEAGGAGHVTTVTFEEPRVGQTLLVVRDLYPSKAAMDDAIASGSANGEMVETFEQLDALLAAAAR